MRTGPLKRICPMRSKITPEDPQFACFTLLHIFLSLWAALTNHLTMRGLTHKYVDDSLSRCLLVLSEVTVLSLSKTGIERAILSRHNADCGYEYNPERRHLLRT